MEMCKKVEEALEKKRYHVSPKFFLCKTLPKEDKDKAKEIAKKMKAKIVDSDQEATHVLYPSTGKLLRQHEDTAMNALAHSSAVKVEMADFFLTPSNLTASNFVAL